MREYKDRIEGQDKPLADREGRGVAGWWGKKFDKSVSAKEMNEAKPQELPAGDVKRSNVAVHKTGVAIDDLPEFRNN